MVKTFIFLVIVVCWFCCGQQAGADEICLKNGNIIEGIVVRDTETALELEVFLGAKITFHQQVP